MEHHKPHASAVFEGYYSKFDLPSGAHLALIACKVKDAKLKPFMVSFTYVPPQDAAKTFQRELWSESMEMKPNANGNGFQINIPGTGYIKWDTNRTEYDIDNSEFSFKATSSTRTPWSKDTDTPESLLVRLPLPLHWHVQSLASKCHFNLEIPNQNIPEEDKTGEAMIHDEKNWAHSFPSAHMWLQARDGDRSFCCAGGQILGMEAFLLGYRSKNLNIDFRPPFALRFGGLSPFMSYSSNWDSRTFEARIQSFRQKITIRASAPIGSFFSLSSPFPEGHRENFLGQSFQATIEVKVYESGWFSPWKLIREDKFEQGSLEFGGAYYPPAGSKQRFH